MEYLIIILVMLFIVLCASLAGLYLREKECNELEEKLEAYKLRRNHLLDENYGLRIEIENLKGLNEALNARIRVLEINKKGI